MSRHHETLSNLCVAGVLTTLAGVIVLGGAGPSTVPGAVGAGAMIIGFFCTLQGILRAEAGGQLMPEAAAMVTCGGVAGGEQPERVACADSMSAPTETSPLAHVTDCFLAWLDHRDQGADRWSDFDRWVRDILNDALGARRIRCYRVSENRLQSLSDGLDDSVLLGNPTPGLIQRVIETGQEYLRGSGANGELVDQLAREWAENLAARSPSSAAAATPDWILPIRSQRSTVGLIVAGELPLRSPASYELLGGISSILGLCWRHVQQADELALAHRTDRGSGVLNRLDLAAQAEQVIAEAREDGEPLVVLTVAIEGARRLDDQGHWELRNWLMRQIGHEMLRKLRSDDLIGRFSDDRFVAVLRRLDLSLGQLIAAKVLEALKAGLAAQPEVLATVSLRCGLAVGGNAPFETSLTQSFDALQQARAERRELLVYQAGTTKGAGS